VFVDGAASSFSTRLRPVPARLAWMPAFDKAPIAAVAVSTSMP
jgi:hypothetical protein